MSNLRISDSSMRDQIFNLFYNEGFELVGAVNKENCQIDQQYFKQWIDKGFHADLDWVENNSKFRNDPCSLIDNGASILIAAINYNSKAPSSWKENHYISNYAWGTDYHLLLKKKLKRIQANISKIIPGFKSRGFVDSAPIPERVVAFRAGLGWVGKNGMLINRKLGSFLFLAEIVCNLTFEFITLPAKDYCGTCVKCIEACPNQAIIENGVVDSRRCISYLTIEKRGEFTPQEKSMVDYQVFGCDICQQVCPWNKKSPITSQNEFCLSDKWKSFNLSELKDLSQESFDKLKIRSAIKRAKFEGFKRNVKAILEKNA